jgi:hypothetical protein
MRYERETRQDVLGLRLRRAERELLDRAASQEGEATSTWARRSLVGLAALELGGRDAQEEER